MKLERRSWAAVGLVCLLAAFAVALERPVALAGGVVLGAWVLAGQAAFFRELTRVHDSMVVEQVPTRTGVRTVDSTPVSLLVRLAEPVNLAMIVESGLPRAARASDSLTLALEPEMTGARKTVPVSWPVAGRHRFDPATVSATDGRFRETLEVGETATITVEPPGPGNVHVGRGGDRVLSVYGEHEGERVGSGIEPAEIREYVPGDTPDQIDWNATARLGTPHIREYETETDRQTVLVVDHRESLATGGRLERKLDYLREVALTTIASARRLDDPIGLYTVGDAGLTHRIAPSPGPQTYLAIRRRLLDLEPTALEDAVDASDDASARPRERLPSTAYGTSSSLRRATGVGVPRSLLAGGEDVFVDRLRPFYAGRALYREQIDDDPLFGAVRRVRAGDRAPLRVILFTDDAEPERLRRTVEHARANGDEVVVLLAPTVLYEPGGLADVERAYDRYLDFEAFRRELTRMDRVTALEVCPGDELTSVLEVGRSAVDASVGVGGEPA